MAPWNGVAPSQVFGRTDGTRTGSDTWAQAAAAPVDIVATDHDVHDEDVATGLNACLKKDGGNTATADLPMGGFTLTNIDAAGARTEPARFSDVQDNKGQYVATVGGTADAITLTPAIAITAYAAGQRFSFISGGDNTGATTVAVSGLTATTVRRNDGSNTALSAGDIQSGAIVDIEYDGTRFLLLSIIGGLTASNNLSDVASATTARTNLGVGTGDSPQFAGINVGHASDTTITRTGAGDLAVEGNLMYRAGGTDVPVTDGGTGASTASGARSNLGVPYASQANMEAAAANVVVTPDVQHFHPSAAKAWVKWNDNSGTPTIDVSRNVTSLDDNGTGDQTVNFTTAFSTANYAVAGASQRPATNSASFVTIKQGTAPTASALRLQIVADDASAHDTNYGCAAVFGDL